MRLTFQQALVTQKELSPSFRCKYQHLVLLNKQNCNMKSKSTTPRSFYPSRPKLFPALETKASKVSPLLDYTTNSTLWNDNTLESENQIVFTLDAIITNKSNGFTYSKLIRPQKQKHQSEMVKLEKRVASVLTTEPGKQYYNSFIQQQREKKIQKKFMDLLEGQRQEFERKVRVHSVNRCRLKLSDAVKQKKCSNLEGKRNMARYMKKKLDEGLYQAAARRERSLEDNKFRRDEVFESQLRIKDRRREFQDLRKNRARTNLEDRICKYDQEAREASDALFQLKQKQLGLEKRNLELIDQFYKAMNAIKKLEV